MSCLRLIWPCGPFQRRPLRTTRPGGSAASLITQLINIALLRLLMDTLQASLVAWRDRLDLLLFQLFAWLARSKKVTANRNHWVCGQHRPESPLGWCHFISFYCHTMQQGNNPFYSMLKINKTKTSSSLILKSLLFLILPECKAPWGSVASPVVLLTSDKSHLHYQSCQSGKDD